jgi:7-cyano-7-deazaguanine reductase
MTLIKSIPQLGMQTAYPSHYDPGLLFPINRAVQRANLPLLNKPVLPFFGIDIWNAYELGWLNTKGKPQIALAEFIIPADSPMMIESKSLKLYLNSLNNERFLSSDELGVQLKNDLSTATGASVQVRILEPEKASTTGIQELTGVLLDRLDLEVDPLIAADPTILSADQAAAPIKQCLVSHLLKSNCPVTNQPDWASIQIQYFGRPINEEGLLRYLIGFRQLGEFHEDCVETIFCAIKERCAPEKLAVFARYTRRGGLDINPFRADYNAAWPANVRHARQ